MTQDSVSYRDAGVDIDAADETKGRIRDLARQTFTQSVLTDIGSFGALFRADFGPLHDPVLVSSVDGVGTKLKIAFMSNTHNTVGYDLVAHCVNDILVQGARPLFFMDYIALSKMDPMVVEQIIDGLARGCREAGCALIGGETAEMPGFYHPGEYDVAGFIVGVVQRDNIIDGRTIRPGDKLLGLPSLGLHTNGFSLARKLLFDVAGHHIDTFLDELGCTVGTELLKPHCNYLPRLERLLDGGQIKGLIHVTGGGFMGNIPRVLPPQCAVQIHEGTWPVPPVFDLLKRLGNVQRDEMYRTFNMGIGMIIVTSTEDAEDIQRHMMSGGKPVYDIGEVIDNADGQVRITET